MSHGPHYKQLRTHPAYPGKGWFIGRCLNGTFNTNWLHHAVRLNFGICSLGRGDNK